MSCKPTGTHRHRDKFPLGDISVTICQYLPSLNKEASDTEQRAGIDLITMWNLSASISLGCRIYAPSDPFSTSTSVTSPWNINCKEAVWLKWSHLCIAELNARIQSPIKSWHTMLIHISFRRRTAR